MLLVTSCGSRQRNMLAALKATRQSNTTDISCNGSGMRKPKCTTAMVTICPTTAIQRSWMSCRMFSRPVWSSKIGDRSVCTALLEITPCAPRPSQARQLLAYHDPGADDNQQCQPIPGDRVRQVRIAEGDTVRPPTGARAAAPRRSAIAPSPPAPALARRRPLRLRIDKIRRHPATPTPARPQSPAHPASTSDSSQDHSAAETTPSAPRSAATP